MKGKKMTIGWLDLPPGLADVNAVRNPRAMIKVLTAFGEAFAEDAGLMYDALDPDVRRCARLLQDEGLLVRMDHVMRITNKGCDVLNVLHAPNHGERARMVLINLLERGATWRYAFKCASEYIHEKLS